MKFDDTLFVLLAEYCKGGNIDKDIMNKALRKYDDVLIKEQGVWLSEQARLSSNVNILTEHNSKKTSGLHLEHIIPVGIRLNDIIFNYQNKFIRDKKDISDYIINTFYAVYKKRGEPLEGFEAEIYLPKENREPKKILYYEKYSAKR